MKIFITASSLKFIHRYCLFLNKENENELHVKTQEAVLNFLISLLTSFPFFSAQTFAVILDWNKKKQRKHIGENSLWTMTSLVITHR